MKNSFIILNNTKTSKIMSKNNCINVWKRFQRTGMILLLGLSFFLSGVDSVSGQKEAEIIDKNIFAEVLSTQHAADEELITIQFTNITLKAALELLAKRLNVGFSYNPDILPDKTVDFGMSNEPAHIIIYKLLEDTNLEPVLPPSKDVIILKEKEPKNSFVAQTGDLSGTVLDQRTNEAVPGANVLIRELERGASTDPDGNYTITDIPYGTYSIRVSFIGYEELTREVVIDSPSQTLDLRLAGDVFGLDELVVTGTGGEVSRKSLGHTVSSVDFEAAEFTSSNSIQDALQGKIAGVNVNLQSGMVDQEPKIRIRGTSSISMSNQPIIYVDGIRVQGLGGFAPGVGTGGLGAPSALSNINFDAVERVEILKGPAAATLYGSQANSGVIQIFTKQGKTESAPQFNVKYGTKFIQMPDRFKKNTGFVETAEEQENVRNVLGLDVDFYEPFESPVQLIDLYDTGLGQELSAGVQGGGEGVTYYTNLSYSQTDGPFNPQPSTFNGGAVGDANDLYKKLFFSGNLNLIPSDDLRFSIQSSYTNSNSSVYGSGITIYTPTSSSRYAKPERVGQASEFDTFGIPFFATVREGTYTEISDNANQGRLALQTNYFIRDGLSVDATFGVDYRDQRSREFSPFGYAVDGVAPNKDGTVTIGNRQQLVWTYEGKLKWDFDINQDLQNSFVTGFQGFREETNSAASTGNNFSGPGLTVLGATASQSSVSSFQEVVNLGVFAQDQIDYKDWMYWTVGVRLDASSAFGDNFNYATYPKLSLSLLPFDALNTSVSGISTFRLRAAIGQSGQQPGAFDRFTTFVPVNSPEGSGINPGNLGNNELKPETATEWEVGFDLGLFNEKLNVEATYWDRVVKDALVDRSYAPSGGFTTPQLTNVGQLEGKGVELSIDYDAVQRSDFSLNLFMNAAYLHEQVSSLGGTPAIKVDAGYIRDRMFIKEGYAPGAYFGTALPKGVDFPFDLNGDGTPSNQADLEAFFSNPVDPSTLNAFIMVAGPNGEALPGGTSYLDTYLGKPTPDWEGSFGFSANFLDGFTLSSRFQYAAGNYYHHNLTDAFRRVNSGIGRNFMRSTQLEAILKNPASTTAERIEAGKSWVKEMVALSPYDGLNEVEKADYIRWSNLSLSYNIPESLLSQYGLNSASITASGGNLALWTKYGGVDPLATGEGSLGNDGGLNENFGGGMDTYGTPLLRTITFTLKAGF